MKITAFDPVIVTAKVDDTMKVFEALGFEKRHAPTNSINDSDVTSNRLKHENGYHVDVVAVEQEMPRDLTLIRMNVDDFDETYQILLNHGFKNQQGDEISETESSKTTTMVSPSGFMIGLTQHKKKQEN
jgi:hypothetical protein